MCTARLSEVLIESSALSYITRTRGDHRPVGHMRTHDGCSPSCDRWNPHSLRSMELPCLHAGSVPPKIRAWIPVVVRSLKVESGKR